MTSVALLALPALALKYGYISGDATTDSGCMPGIKLFWDYLGYLWSCILYYSQPPYGTNTSFEPAIASLAFEPTALGVAPKPPAGDEARPPHLLRKAASVSIKGCWERYPTHCTGGKGG